MKFSSFLLSLLISSAAVWSAVSVPAIFSDHAVLQRGDKVPVWGRADAGESVRIQLGNARVETVAAADGKWLAYLDLSQAGESPFDLVVEGSNRLTFTDILVGEVWLCSGQSNMELSLASSQDAKEEIAASANSHLRQFLVEKRASRTPSEDIRGRWMVASPEVSGQFSAVAYYFGKQLLQSLNRPVGLINASVGGTQAEAWISAEELDKDPTLRQAKEKQIAEQDAYPILLSQFATRLNEWQSRHQRLDHSEMPVETFASGQSESTLWKSIQLPYRAGISSFGLSDAGAIWLRRTVNLSENQVAQFVTFDLPITKGFEKIFINGTLIGETTIESGRTVANRQFRFPQGVLRVGENIIAIRVFQPVSGAGDFAIGNGPFRLGLMSLAGDWQIAEEYGFTALEDAALRSAPVPPAIPQHELRVSSLAYNGMIQPLIPYALSGFLWYQGEANTYRANAYGMVLSMLISSWRQKWGGEQLPFIFCQLPNYQARHPQPQRSLWAELREAQDQTLSLPNTGMAVLIDLGEEKDIHPADKKGPGERLAAIALAKRYEIDVPYEGPRYASSRVEGAAIRIEFQDPSIGQVARDLPATYKPSSRSKESVPLVRNRPGSQLEGFSICGTDQQWRWADARIEGDSILVSSPEVPAPVAVRYGWDDNPICNLYSRSGFPAAPFRTDSFATTP